MSDLKAALMDIRGIGEAKADEILDVLDEQGEGASGVYLDKALAAARERDDRAAAMYLRRYDPDT